MTGFIQRRLELLSEPIDLILVGLGFMGYGFLRRIQAMRGMRVVLLITRDPDRSHKHLVRKGVECEKTANLSAIQANSRRNTISICDNYELIGLLPYPIVVEMTGDVAYGAQVAIETFNAGKHLATMNVELHATIGIHLKRYADTRGLLMTDVQGDQPGSLASLIGEARFFGFRPMMAGNIKGYLDRHATPDDIRKWAIKKGLSLKQTTSFTDGTKIALEMSLVANHFGMKTLTTGMYGHRAEGLAEVLTLFDWDEVPEGGCVDYIIGSSLVPGVFVVGTYENTEQASYLKYLKLGDGPQYLLYRPYHLCHIEAPLSVAALALFNEVTINSSHPMTRVSAVAKRDLKEGEVADGIGGYCCYGLLDNMDTPGIEGAVPIGLIEGSIMKRPVKEGRLIRWDDVELPDNMATRLWEETSVK